MESYSKAQDVLCETCIRSTSGVITEFLEMPFHEAGPPPQFVDRGIVPMAHYRNCDKCPVCRLIRKTILMTPGAEEASREKGMVIITKEEFGRYKVPNEEGPGRRVDRLWVQLTFGIDTFTTRVEGTVFARGIQRPASSRKGTTADSASNLFLGRRIPQNQIDIQLVQRWIGYCSAWHPKTCVPRLYTEDFGMRLIDVNKECLVVAAENARYVALSYVWGNVEQRMKDGGLGIILTQSNTTAFMRVSGLRIGHEDLPRTISDAMLFCQMLGVDYLWVDSLCIQQDSSADKDIQIPKMASIYGSAYLTVVAAAGESVWAGLPGVRPFSRRAIQHYESINGVELITAARPFLACITKSKWNTRGWTYMEKLLATRLLIFTEYQIFFHCNEAVWYEDAMMDFQDPLFETNQLESEDMRSRIGELKIFPEASPWNQYQHAVRGYTGRHLTEKRDCLNAFLGIEASLHEKLGNSFIWGLPEIVFDYALSWDWNGAPRPENRHPHAPSWSWMSWMGSRGENIRSGIRAFCGLPRRSRRLVPFFRHDPTTAKLVPIESDLPGMPFTTVDDIAQPSPTREWTSPLDAQPMPSYFSPKPPLSHHLYLYTCTVFLHVDRHRYDSFAERLKAWTDGSRIPKDCPPKPWMINHRRKDLLAPYKRHQTIDYFEYYQIRNERRRAIGTVWLDPQWRAEQPDRLEFMAMLGFVEPRRVLAWLVQRQQNGDEEWVERVQQVMNPFEERHWERCRPAWRWVTLC